MNQRNSNMCNICKAALEETNRYNEIYNSVFRTVPQRYVNRKVAEAYYTKYGRELEYKQYKSRVSFDELVAGLAVVKRKNYTKAQVEALATRGACIAMIWQNFCLEGACYINHWWKENLLRYFTLAQLKAVLEQFAD